MWGNPVESRGSVTSEVKKCFYIESKSCISDKTMAKVKAARIRDGSRRYLHRGYRYERDAANNPPGSDAPVSKRAIPSEEQHTNRSG
jgi:hypothetical protein